MHPSQRLARLTGAIYLLCAFTAPFAMMYVPSRVMVRGDAAATAERIVALEGLFRAGIAVNLVSGVAFASSVLLLYWLFHGVDRIQASFMKLLGLIAFPVGLLSIACDLVALNLLRRVDSITDFSRAQVEELVQLVLGLQGPAATVSELFWGLWLLPCGWLVKRSGFLPRILGWLLIANGVAYVALCFTRVLAPASGDAVLRWALPLMFGELWLALWLLIMGIRRPAAAATSLA